MQHTLTFWWRYDTLSWLLFVLVNLLMRLKGIMEIN